MYPPNVGDILNIKPVPRWTTNTLKIPHITRQWEIPDADPFIDDLPLAAQGFTAPRIWSRHPYRSQQARCSPNALLGHAKKGHEPWLESFHFVMGKSSRSGCEWRMFHQDVPEDIASPEGLTMPTSLGLRFSSVFSPKFTGFTSVLH